MTWNEFHLETFIPAVLIAFIASGGFWNWMLNKKKKPDATTRLLMGLAHIKITEIGLAHIDIGGISEEVFNDLVNYLYEPYVELGGNGSSKRIMDHVEKLPFLPPIEY